MVRAGLSSEWKCLFANDFDPKKGRSYVANWGSNELVVEDINNIATRSLPEHADLVWASFPCQDLSLAGSGAGLRGSKSSAFWPFMDHISNLSQEGRPPKIITLENVTGTLTSHKGKDFTAICNSLKENGYIYGAIVFDAAMLVPQSRPRLFFIALKSNFFPHIPKAKASLIWHTKSLQKAYSNLPDNLKDSWIWWHMPTPPKRPQRLVDVIEDNPSCTKWHTTIETTSLLSMMSDVNLAKVEAAKASGIKIVGGVYKRTRYYQGIKFQRAEVRFDDKAGCLRTPLGGSSRQMILLIEGSNVRSRLLSARETARLMGLPDSYILPVKYNEACHLTGDGVVVPVVRYIAKNIIEPFLLLSRDSKRKTLSTKQNIKLKTKITVG